VLCALLELLQQRWGYSEPVTACKGYNLLSVPAVVAAVAAAAVAVFNMSIFVSKRLTKAMFTLFDARWRNVSTWQTSAWLRVEAY
jgi:hypothetical protein